MPIDSKLPNSIPAQIPNPNTPKIKWSLVLLAAISCLPLASCGAKTGDSPDLYSKCPKGSIVLLAASKENPQIIYVQVGGEPVLTYEINDPKLAAVTSSPQYGGAYCRDSNRIISGPVKDIIGSTTENTKDAYTGKYTYEPIDYSGLCEDQSADVVVRYNPKTNNLSSICSIPSALKQN